MGAGSFSDFGHAPGIYIRIEHPIKIVLNDSYGCSERKKKKKTAMGVTARVSNHEVGSWHP